MDVSFCAQTYGSQDVKSANRPPAGNRRLNRRGGSATRTERAAVLSQKETRIERIGADRGGSIGRRRPPSDPQRSQPTGAAGHRKRHTSGYLSKRFSFSTARTGCGLIRLRRPHKEHGESAPICPDPPDPFFLFSLIACSLPFPLLRGTNPQPENKS